MWTPLPVPHSWTPASATTHSVVLVAGDAAQSSFRVTDGSLSGPWAVTQFTWPGATREVAYSGARGTLGRQPTSSRLQDAPLTIGLALWPDDMDDAAQEVSDLARVVDLIARHGGQVTVRRTNQATRQHFQVLAGTGIQVTPWTPGQEIDGRSGVTIQVVCGPYVWADPMEIADRFATDSRDEYTYDTGTSSSLSVADGQLSPTGTSAVVAVHTAVGHLYGDHQAVIWPTITSTLSGFKCGVVLKRVDASNRLEVYIDDNGTNSRLRIDKVVAAARTNLASLNIARLTAGQRFAVQGRIEGNRVYAEFFTPPEDVVVSNAAFADTAVTLTSGEAATFGKQVVGQAGFVWDPAATGERVEEFHVQPYAYRGAWPADVTMYGAIPGDAPAACDLVVAGGNAPFFMAGWSRRPLGENLAPAGDLDDYPNSHLTDPGDPWSVAAVSGVTGAASSKQTAINGYRSRKCLSVVCPATANTGATLRIARRFKAGTSYTVSAWLKSATGTTNARVRLGVSGDIASTSAAALTTTWVQHTTTWTPTADVDLAYFCAEITAATATTFQVDSVTVYETDRVPTLATQTNGRGGRAPVAVLDAGDGQRLGPGTTYVTGLGATYRNGDAIRMTGTSTSSVAWSVDPDLIDGDDHTGSIEVEVWARIISPAWGSAPGTVVASITSPSGSASNTREYGSTGQVIEPSYTNLSRLGTIAVPRTRGIGQPGRSLLTLTVAPGSLSGNLDIDYVILVPARRRALSPTGKAATGYPAFLDQANAKLIRADLTGYYQDDDATGYGPSSGLGGALLEMEPGEQTFVCTLNQIPDRADASPAATDESTFRVRWSPTPRWHYLRDA